LELLLVMKKCCCLLSHLGLSNHSFYILSFDTTAVYDHYYEDFDFFFLCGDDTHVIVENLRGTCNHINALTMPTTHLFFLFLCTHIVTAVLASMGSDAVQYPLYMGSWFQSPVILPRQRDFYIIHGGGGYVLNKITLKALVVDLADCFATRQSSSEDRWVAQCLNRLGIKGNSSVDDQGRQRFHPEDVRFMATFDGVSDNNGTLRLSYTTESPVSFYGKSYQLWARHTGSFRAAENLTSPSSISFHRLTSPLAMKRHHAILYRSCPPGTALGDRLLLVAARGNNSC
jgi:hypothetical protein